MNRIITILVTIFILLLLYIWISHVWGGDKPRHPRQIVDANDTPMSNEFEEDADTTTYTPSADTMATSTSSGEDEYATERNVAEEPAEEVKTEPVKQEPVKTEPKPEPKKTEPVKTEPKKTTTTSTPASKPTTTNTKPTTTNTKPATTPSKPAATSTAPADGQHLVIAGNFTQKANAEQRVAELKKAGYKDAEVINFDLSEYHTVCVGRFSDVNEARKLVKKLKDYQKIDAYVRIGG